MKTTFIAIMSLVIVTISSCGISDDINDTTASENQTSSGKSPVEPGKKFMLKATDNLYVAINEDGSLGVTQSDSTKAELFEIVDLGNGKVNIKATNGKFLCTDESVEFKVLPNRDSAGPWEAYEIVNMGDSKIYIKAHTGKIVCGDRNKGSVLIANRDVAGEWETFIVRTR
jgi:hypothetical protein